MMHAVQICKEASKAQALVVRDLMNVLPSIGSDGVSADTRLKQTAYIYR
jgi:hypothetical protein